MSGTLLMKPGELKLAGIGLKPPDDEGTKDSAVLV